MTTRTFRFAPSPTGRLHLGNARPCVLNGCMAVKTGGRFILRLDDTDRERSTEAFAQAILEDVAWLGFAPDAVVRQSDRLERYAAAAQALREKGLLYACYDTEEELEKKRRLARAMHKPPIYDRAGLRLSAAERAGLEAQGRRPHWRFKLSGESVTWEDGVRGPQHVETASLSDPVLIREDGTPLYTFTSVVDDAEMGVTDIIRGEDHVTNTGVQIEIFRALGATPPAFAHHNLFVDADGQGLSKRTGSLSLGALREAGIEGVAVAAYVALVGSSEAVRPVPDLAALAELVDLSRLSRAPARIDPEDLAELSARTLHITPYETVAPRLASLGVGGGEGFWNAVRANCTRLGEAAEWWQVATGDIAPVIEDADFLADAQRLMPPEPWDGSTWGAWTTALKEATGRKGKALFHPLRLALTGRERGPELAALLPFIGAGRAAARLRG